MMKRFDRRMCARVGLALIFAGGGSSAGAQSDAGRPLREAAAAGRAEDVRRLLATSAGREALDARDASGQTPLLLAVAQGRDAAALVLIEAGADINAQARNSDTPWLLAGADGRVAMLRAMLATGRVDYAKRNRYGGNALIPAAHHGHVEAVAFLLAESKIDVDHVNNLGWTALLEAIILGDGGPAHTEIVRLLIAGRASVNLADREGVSPLQHARRRGYGAIAAMLMSAGAT